MKNEGDRIMAKTNPEERPMGKWVSYRPEIKSLDCTIRDGRLMNEHLFDDRIVKAVYSACVFTACQGILVKL